jgi:hypothetical protein
MNAKDLDQCPPRLQRLKTGLSRFYFQVLYVLRKQLWVADTLSPAPHEKGDEVMASEMEAYIRVISLDH